MALREVTNFMILRLDEEEAHGFYKPLEKALEAARSMLTSELDRVTEILETCQERFGKTVQEQYVKRKADTNSRKNKNAK